MQNLGVHINSQRQGTPPCVSIVLGGRPSPIFKFSEILLFSKTDQIEEFEKSTNSQIRGTPPCVSIVLTGEMRRGFNGNMDQKASDPSGPDAEFEKSPNSQIRRTPPCVSIVLAGEMRTRLQHNIDKQSVRPLGARRRI